MLKDTLIISFIILIFIAVILVFYTEIMKNNDIKSAKNNFFFVKEEIIKSINNCNDKTKESWIFGGLCTEAPEIENISQYFNIIQKLVNPYDNKTGVEGGPGSVLIQLVENQVESQFIFSIDVDADGGIDITQFMKF